MSLGAGQLQVRVGWADGRIQAVDCQLQRPRQALQKLLVSGTLADALQRLPLLYGICSQAQQLAAVTAIEQAGGLRASPAVADLRTRLLLVERVREAAMQLVRGWGLPWSTGVLKSLLAVAQQASQLGVPVLQPGAARAPDWPDSLQAPLEALYQQMRGESLQDWLRPRLASLPQARLQPLTGRPILVPTARLLELPDDGEQLPLTGPAALGLSETAARRLIGVRIEALWRGLQQDLSALLSEVPPDALCGFRDEVGAGLGWVLTSRGWLAHRVILQQGRPLHWQIQAPTDCNFQGRSLLAGVLESVPVARDQLEALVNPLVLSLNPCVGFEVQVYDA